MSVLASGLPGAMRFLSSSPKHSYARMIAPTVFLLHSQWVAAAFCDMPERTARMILTLARIVPSALHCCLYDMIMRVLTRTALVDGGFIYANRTVLCALAFRLCTDDDVEIAYSIECSFECRARQILLPVRAHKNPHRRFIRNPKMYSIGYAFGAFGELLSFIPADMV